MFDLDKASSSLAGVLGSLGLAACGPLGPAIDETGDPSDGTSDPTVASDPTMTSDPTDPTDPTETPPPPECNVDADCDQGYCGSYCLEGRCQESYGCCDSGLKQPHGGEWRCTPPPYYDCYDDSECADGYVCASGSCVIGPPIPLPACRPPDMEVRQWNLGEAPDAFVLADLDLDMDLDLAAAQPAAGTVEIALNDGAGNFTSASEIVIDGGSDIELSLTPGDIDGDGDLDLVVARAAPGGVLQLLFNDGGVFTPGEALPPNGPPHQVALGDTNGDGALDLITIYPTAPQLGLRLGDGAGGFFVEQPAIDAAIEPRALVVDVTGDGIADLLAPLGLEAATALWLGAVEGLVSAHQFVSDSELGTPIAGHVDQVASSDVIVVEPADAGGLVHVWLSGAPGSWGDVPARYQTISPLLGGVLGQLSPAPGDDLVAATGLESVAMLVGDGDGKFACEHVQPTFGSSTPSLLAVGDVDGDGRADIVAGGALVTTITMVLLK